VMHCRAVLAGGANSGKRVLLATQSIRARSTKLGQTSTRAQPYQIRRRHATAAPQHASTGKPGPGR
jgi:hypothetical protein